MIYQQVFLSLTDNEKLQVKDGNYHDRYLLIAKNILIILLNKQP